MKYKLTIAYDGTDFCGWQNQPNGVSIQNLLEEKLAIILKRKVSVTGAGRTDAGVHALGQVAHFSFDTALDLNRLKGSLNGLLPLDIRVKECIAVSDEFHARYSAKSKEYHYHLNFDSYQNPFTRRYSWYVPNQIDLNLLKQGAKIFIGEHDFTSFANESHSGAAAKNPVRTISDIRIIQRDDGVRLEFCGQSFLYKMVRNLTGVLVDIARGKVSLEQAKQILQAKDRKQATKAAPAKGLFLVKIDY